MNAGALNHTRYCRLVPPTFSCTASPGTQSHASDIMMVHPLALQLRNLQTLIEIGVDKNTTVVFPAPLMSTIQEIGAFLSRETGAVAKLVPPSAKGADRPSPTAHRGNGFIVAEAKGQHKLSGCLARTMIPPPTGLNWG